MSVKRLNDDVETVNEFCCLGNILNTSAGSKMTIVARTRIGWMKFENVKKLCMEKDVR